MHCIALLLHSNLFSVSPVAMFFFILASQLEVAHLAGSAIRIRIFPRSFNSCGRVAGREEGFW